MKLNKHVKILIEEDSFTKSLPSIPLDVKEIINAIAFNYGGFHSLDFLRLINKTVEYKNNPLGSILSIKYRKSLLMLIEHCGGSHTLKFMFEFYYWVGHDKKSFYIGLIEQTNLSKQNQLQFDKILG